MSVQIDSQTIAPKEEVWISHSELFTLKSGFVHLHVNTIYKQNRNEFWKKKCIFLLLLLFF